jgi:hypothetical protein
MTEEQATGTAELPPSLRENFDTLKQEGQTVVTDEQPKKRGRKPGSKNKPKDEPVTPLVEFPVEALSLAHREIWHFVAKRLQSQYRLSEEGAKEMGNYASLVIAQYLGPYLAKHQALAAYMLTQVTALTVIIVTREPKPKEEKPKEVTSPTIWDADVVSR